MLRVGAICAWVATPLAIVPNILHPRIADFSKHIDKAHGPGWIAIHVSILTASLVAIGFQSVLADTLALERVSGQLARHGFYFVLIGNAILAAWIAVDGLAIHELSVRVAAGGVHHASNSSAVLAAEKIDASLESMWFLVYWGVSGALYGLATLFSARFPRWLGVVAFAAGIGSLSVAIVQSFTGITVPLVVAASICAGLLTLWIFVTGSLLWRLASTGDAGMAAAT